jgi:Protein of unknown function (DUF2878)
MYFWWMILGFQAVWFSCAWGISHDYPLLPLLVSLVYLNSYITNQTSKKTAYMFLLKILLMGFVLDSLLGLLGLLSAKSSYPAPLQFLQPWWLSLLWLSFAASAKASFSWLSEKKYLTLVLGGVFGPIAYYSGLQLGSFYFVKHLAYPLLAAGFASIMFLMMRLIRQQANALQSVVEIN